MKNAILTRRKKPLPRATGNCFENSFLFVQQNPEWTLVHGVAVGMGPIKGVKFIHAWAEFNGMVYDVESGVVAFQEIYYGMGQICYTIKYSYREALEQVVESEHYGFWDERLKPYDHT